MIDLRPLPRPIVISLLVAILLSGFTLRVWDLNFDQGLGSHPDERSTVCFHATAIALPQSWGQFWDPRRSPLNPLWDREQQQPRSFTYGHFPLYLGVLMGHAFHWSAPIVKALGAPSEIVALMQRGDNACDAIAVAGRLTIALLDTLTIGLLYLLGGRLFGCAGGLLAAGFYAFAAQAIQLSHFFAMDPASTTFIVWAVLGGVGMLHTQRLRLTLMTGLACGLAISSKFSALPVVAVPTVAAILVVWRARREKCLADRPVTVQVRFLAIIGIVVAWLTAFVAFFLTSPYAVLDWDIFSRAVLVDQGMMVRGIADFPFTRQYRNTFPYLYFIQQQVRWGLGWPLGLVALAGTGYAFGSLIHSIFHPLLVRLPGRHSASKLSGLSDTQLAHIVIWSWVLPYFVITGAFLAKFNRYMSPLLPFVLLWGAWLIVMLWRSRRKPSAEGCMDVTYPVPGAETSSVEPVPLPRTWDWKGDPARWTAIGLALLGLVGGLFWSLAYVNGVYQREHTWITASRWIYENAPRGSVLLWELWDDPLPKSIPGEPGMDMHTAGLTHIDWSPYEEDTADKYEIMKRKLREANFVIYSSKRIYDSVDELPERYPMTIRYYKAMRDGRLGFELAHEVTSPPRLFGQVIDDRHADESFSLYDHPQVTIFRKVRELSDAEFEALFQRSWERAIPHYRGPDSPLSPLMEALGMGHQPGSEQRGLINLALGLSGVGQTSSARSSPNEPSKLILAPPLRELPPVDNYRWNIFASEQPLAAIVWWWCVLTLLGWVAWPLMFRLFRPLRDAGFLLSRTFGWLLGGWLLWMLSSLGLLRNTVAFAWISLSMVACAGAFFAYRQRNAMGAFIRAHWQLMTLGEAIFAAAFLAFVWVRMQNPDLWQPWVGGEKQMEFAFLNGILRSPTFPPLDPHFANGVINYYYFGLYQVAYLIKLTGIYAEVAFNLAIPTLFALTLINVFAVAYSAANRGNLNHRSSSTWLAGLGAALLAPLYVTILGNLEGFAQVVRDLSRLSPAYIQSAIPGHQEMASALEGFRQVASGTAVLPPYDFWAPSRVIENTINEFPFWSFLFADLHPHLIGIPITAMFLALALVLILNSSTPWRTSPRRGFAMLALFALLLGTIASINLWELPTYFGLGILTFLVSQFRGHGRIDWPITFLVAGVSLCGAYLLFLPFFNNFINVAASGLGLVRAPDSPERWFLIWGFFFFILMSWTLLQTLTHSAKVRKGVRREPTALDPWIAALVPFTLVSAIVAWLLGWSVLSLCISWLGLAVALLWQRDEGADAGALLATVLTVTGLAILAGTQVLYLKDFLHGGDNYRMNTLFKFFSQVWVIWGIAAAIVTPHLFKELFGAWPRTKQLSLSRMDHRTGLVIPRSAIRRFGSRVIAITWVTSFGALFLASLAYPILGTPARLEKRMPGWRPEIGTLNGLDFMRAGSYAWPNHHNVFDLREEWLALQWLLRHIPRNAVILESSELDYYRAWGTRVASYTGLTGLNGMHEQEQRFPEAVESRRQQHRELWETADLGLTEQLMEDLAIDLIYLGQMERLLHPDGVRKFETMAARGRLTHLYENGRVTILGLPHFLDGGEVQ